MDSLYNENHIWGRLFRKFMDLFPQAIKPTKKLLALFLIGQLYTEHFTSVRNLHKTFYRMYVIKSLTVTTAHFQMTSLPIQKCARC